MIMETFFLMDDPRAYGTPFFHQEKSFHENGRSDALAQLHKAP
jgi:hypothetical protein